MTIALLGILLTLALPSFTGLLQRYRVGMAAGGIANILQYARAEAIRTRSSTDVGQTTASEIALADPGCTPSDLTDWHCGINVYTDPNRVGAQSSMTTQPTLRTLPASSFNALSVQLANNGTAENTLLYAPLGYMTCTGCAANGASGFDGLIYIWPTANSPTPTVATHNLSTVCATRGGKVRIIPSFVPAGDPNQQCGT